jgi:hypothetical protein
MRKAAFSEGSILFDYEHPAFWMRGILNDIGDFLVNYPVNKVTFRIIQLNIQSYTSKGMRCTT